MVGSAAKQDESDEEESSSGKAAGLSGMMLSCGPGSYCPLCCQDLRRRTEPRESEAATAATGDMDGRDENHGCRKRTWSETVSSLERVMNTVLDDANAHFAGIPQEHG